MSNYQNCKLALMSRFVPACKMQNDSYVRLIQPFQFITKWQQQQQFPFCLTSNNIVTEDSHLTVVVYVVMSHGNSCYNSWVHIISMINTITIKLLNFKFVINISVKLLFCEQKCLLFIHLKIFYMYL